MEVSRSLHCDWYVTKSVNFSGAHLTSWCVFVLIVGPYIPPLEEHRALPRWRQREGNPLPFRNNRILWDLPDIGTIRKRRTAGISVVIYESYRRETDGSWRHFSQFRLIELRFIKQMCYNNPNLSATAKVYSRLFHAQIESIPCLLVQKAVGRFWWKFGNHLQNLTD